jgi:hypothetical protein
MFVQDAAEREVCETRTRVGRIMRTRVEAFCQLTLITLSCIQYYTSTMCADCFQRK